MKKELTLQFTDYVIKGTADLTLWDNNNASITMKAFKTKNIKPETLLKGINDNGFGSQNINGAICDIFENYEGTLRYKSTITVGDVSEQTENAYAIFV